MCELILNKSMLLSCMCANIYFWIVGLLYVMGVTRLHPLDEVNIHDEVILNDEETSHH